MHTMVAVLLATTALCVAAPAAGPDRRKPPQRAPFRVLFSNDTTNIISNDSPFHRRGEPFTPDKLRASIDETVGKADAHMLQPGGGWVPWWRSTHYPADEHYRWLENEAGLKLDSIGQYMRDGGDLVQVFVDHCRRRRIAPFISLRLNDYHGNEYADLIANLLRGTDVGENSKPGIQACGLGRFYLEHPEYRLDEDPEEYRTNPDRLAFTRDHTLRYKLRTSRIFNWAIPEVRSEKLAFIRELCEGYDLDGFELDFMRHSRYFRPGETTPEQRVRIMTDFVSEVRRLLDRTARPGRKRWLCVRVPLRLCGHSALGIDLPKLAAAGVDMVNLSCHYVSEQQSDLAAICAVVPRASVYLELTFTNLRYIKPEGPKTSSNSVYRKMTPQQFYTAAHLAYARGGAGVSAFNFVYYRSLAESQSLGEPPFHVLERMRHPAWVARQPQHYFLTPHANPAVPEVLFPSSKMLAPGAPMMLAMDMAPPAGGWRSDGRLRVQTKLPLRGSELAVRFNGTELSPTDDVSEPYPAPYPDGLGTADTLRAWTVPAELLQDGANDIQVALTSGESVTLVFIDLAVK